MVGHITILTAIAPIARLIWADKMFEATVIGKEMTQLAQMPNDSLLAEISGLAKGKLKSQKFPMKRVK